LWPWHLGVKEIDYAHHVVHPVEGILDTVLGDPELMRPLVIASDRGCVWQGNQWPVADARERAVLAKHFKLGRCARAASDAHAATGKVWVAPGAAAAHGRFAWGGIVRGSTSLFKHGGVSYITFPKALKHDELG
jgi:hypothetical protein